MQNDFLNQKGTRIGDGESSSRSTTNVSSNRVKKMRGWLGIKGDGFGGHFDDGGGFVDYGDAPNGWNR